MYNMEANVLMISSVTVNLCVLLVLIFTWILRRQRITEKRRLRRVTSDSQEEEPQTPETTALTTTRYITKKSSNTYRTIDVFVFSDVIISFFCFGVGLFITTSSSVWQCPFQCASHEHVTSGTPSKDQDGWSPFGQTISTLLSISLGAYVFTIFHLMFSSCWSNSWNLWTVLRSGYLFVNVVSLSVILRTGENLLGANLIVLMEIDTAIEGLCQILDRYTTQQGLQVRKSRIILSIVGIATSFGTRIIMTWVLSISLSNTYNPIAMSVSSLAIASFGFIFYQAYTLLVVKQHVDRIKHLHHCGGSEADGNGTIESYKNGYCKGRIYLPGRKKDMAFYMMNEGVAEISSYAKTVAGAITGKKLFHINNLTDSLPNIKPKSSVVISSMIK